MRRSKRYGRPKKKSQFAHMKRRVYERFGLRITDNDFWEIIRIIQRGDAKHIYKQSNRVSHFLLTYQEKEMIVVYDKLRTMIVTFLQPEKYDWERT